MTRVLSRDGNVISADFRPQLVATVHAEVLYLDHLVCLCRVTLSFGGRVVAVEHVTQQHGCPA
jgi:hypothetical protein